MRTFDIMVGMHAAWCMVLEAEVQYRPSRFLLPISSRQIIDESISIAAFFPPN